MWRGVGYLCDDACKIWNDQMAMKKKRQELRVATNVSKNGEKGKSELF